MPDLVNWRWNFDAVLWLHLDLASSGGDVREGAVLIAILSFREAF